MDGGIGGREMVREISARVCGLLRKVVVNHVKGGVS
jgi:hypothetical protein